VKSGTQPHPHAPAAGGVVLFVRCSSGNSGKRPWWKRRGGGGRRGDGGGGGGRGGGRGGMMGVKMMFSSKFTRYCTWYDSSSVRSCSVKSRSHCATSDASLSKLRTEAQ
jgi:hypothetical protein